MNELPLPQNTAGSPPSHPPPDYSNLTAAQQEDLKNALVSAFPTLNALDRMLRPDIADAIPSVDFNVTVFLACSRGRRRRAG